MSILAEPRRRHRLSVDPQNLGWKNDEGKFGKKILEKMGWSAGRGLGRKEQGLNENVKLKANYTAKGLGYNRSYDDTWIEHHDDFAELLANLNKNRKTDGKEEPSNEPQSLEKRLKLSKARRHYDKFTRGKDLTNYSDQDKAAVLGSCKTSKTSKRKHDGQIHFINPDEKETESDEPNTVRSELSINDYFAEKMKKIRRKNEENQ